MWRPSCESPSLGDVVLATAAVESLREDPPDAEGHVLTKPSLWEVFRGNPGVARLVRWNLDEGMGIVARGLRAEGYDAAAALHGNIRMWLLRFLVPRPRWSRYHMGSLRRRAAVWLRRPGLLPETHVVDCYLAALIPLGVMIMGATNTGRSHPAPEHTHLALGPERRPCRFKTCPKELACLTGLTPDRVFRELESWTRETLGWEAP